MLESIHVAIAPRPYPVHIRLLDTLAAAMEEVGLTRGPVVVVTDDNVHRFYGETIETVLVRGGWSPHFVVCPPGEGTKSHEHLNDIYDEVLRRGIERTTPLVALGGGVIGDLAGFAAATLLRGIPLVQVPTTLIAQVDSAIGGKTGINHTVGKNLIGAFYQPTLVFSDPTLLSTLPPREWNSGLAEVVKHGLIADAQFIGWFEQRWAEINVRDTRVVARMVRHAASIKAGIVQEDVFESGRRALLNFGHTFAHAIERTAGYGTFTHGEAVAVGMRAALHLSSRVYPDFDAADSLRLVARIPVEPDVSVLSTARLMEAMQFDKKIAQGGLRFVILRAVGEALLKDGIAGEWVREALEQAKSA